MARAMLHAALAMRRKHPLALVSAALVLTGAGCLGRTLPIPPPGATSSGVDCPITQCPGGGVVVTIDGSARPGALVIAENLARQHPDGRRFTASAFANDAPLGGDGGVADGGDAGSSSPGSYEIVLSPQPNAVGPVTVSQHGDAIEVRQFVRQDDGSWLESGSVMITAP